jgi:hypothetical protein
MVIVLSYIQLQFSSRQLFLDIILPEIQCFGCSELLNFTSRINATIRAHNNCGVVYTHWQMNGQSMGAVH